jgi:hypothetical protein
MTDESDDGANITAASALVPWAEQPTATTRPESVSEHRSAEAVRQALGKLAYLL